MSEKQARSPIEQMIDSVVFCTVCGRKGIGNCNCWITLRCPKCGKEQLAKRDEIEPDNAAVVQFPCPECNLGGFDDAVQYFDLNGAAVIPDWAKD